MENDKQITDTTTVGVAGETLDAEFDGGAATSADGQETEGAYSPENGKPAERTPQSAEANASAAARRRRQEARAVEREAEHSRIREQAILDALGGKNPYTGGEMRDSADVREFLTMREIEKEGRDPIGDYAAFLKEKERTTTAEQESEAQKEAWFKEDRERFIAEHPDVSLDELINDESFRAYAEGKVGERPLSEIYQGYAHLLGTMEQRANEAAARKLANAKASPGALSGQGDPESGYFSREQVEAMSREEVKKHYAAIQRSMPKWK